MVAVGAVVFNVCARTAYADFGFPPPANLTTTQGIVRGAVVTLVVELLIVVVYCRRHRLPEGRLVVACLIGNALSLPVVWFCSVVGWALAAFFGALVFILVELLAALAEGVVYRWIGHLRWREAIRLGLLANAATMLLGIADQAWHYKPKSNQDPSFENRPSARARP
jgi:hypothetical protein